MKLRQRSRTNPILIVLLSCICIALIGFGVYLFLHSATQAPDTILPVFQVEDLDPAAQIGSLPGSPRGESEPAEDVFAYRINSTPTFDDEGKNGNILVENPASNQYLMVLEIAPASGGAMLYQSKYIAPNQYIESIDLAASLDAGTYEAVAYLNAVDPQTLELVGTLECPITIQIGKE